MTFSLSALPAFLQTGVGPGAGATIAVGTDATGVAGNPLEGFMALLQKLGLKVTGGDTATDMVVELDSKGGTGAGAKTGFAKPDPTTALAALLASLGSDSEADPAKALAASLEPHAKTDGDANQPAEQPDMATLLALIGGLVAQEQAAPKSIAGPTSGTDASAIALPANPTLSLARSLASTMAEITPGDVSTAATDVQTAFGELEALIRQQSAGDATTAEAPANDGKPNPLADILARLTASNRPANTTPPPAPIAAAVAERAAASSPDPLALAVIDATSAPTQLFGSSPTQPIVDAGDATQIVAPPADSDTLMQHHLDLARDSEWLDTLAKDIARAAQNDTHLRFQLNPEHLGSLKVELINSAQGTSVRLTADTEAARTILTDAQPRLIAEARAQGLRISESSVDLSNQGGNQRQAAEPFVLIRTPAAALAAEVELSRSASSGERYA